MYFPGKYTKVTTSCYPSPQKKGMKMTNKISLNLGPYKGSQSTWFLKPRRIAEYSTQKGDKGMKHNINQNTFDRCIDFHFPSFNNYLFFKNACGWAYTNSGIRWLLCRNYRTREHTNKIKKQSHKQHNFGGEIKNPAPNRQSGKQRVVIKKQKAHKTDNILLSEEKGKKITDAPRRGRWHVGNKQREDRKRGKPKRSSKGLWV